MLLQGGEGDTEVASDDGRTFALEEHLPSSLLRRYASVEEVANMVVYISSKEASATNGAALRVDGGVVGTTA